VGLGVGTLVCAGCVDVWWGWVGGCTDEAIALKGDLHHGYPQESGRLGAP